MERRIHVLIAMALLAGMAGGPVGLRAEPASAEASGPFSSPHPELRAALARIARGSPSWRQAAAAVAATGRQAVVVTPDDVVVRDLAGGHGDFDRSEVAAAAPVLNAQGHVAAVLVVVNVERIQAAHDRLSSLPGEFHADLERVLAHEVYGHAVPYLLTGDLAARCADPLPGATAAEACAIKRENVIRGELRLGRRTDSALGSLAFARLSGF